MSAHTAETAWNASALPASSATKKRLSFTTSLERCAVGGKNGGEALERDPRLCSDVARRQGGAVSA